MSSASIPAVLSVRLPSPSRDRLKVAAATRGETVQDLVGTLVERFLAEDGRQAPGLAAVLRALRAGAPWLRTRSVRGLWVVGPVARGDARPGSGVEIECEFEPGARVSLVALASLWAELSELLGAPVALAERGGASDRCGDGDAVRAL